MAPSRTTTECLDHEVVVDVLLWLRNHRVPDDEVDVMMRRVFRIAQRLLPRRDPAIPLRPWIKAITDRHCLRSARLRHRMSPQRETVISTYRLRAQVA